MTVPCTHHKSGRCSMGLYDGTPSIGVCLKQCDRYDGPDRTPELIARHCVSVDRPITCCTGDTPIYTTRWGGETLGLPWWMRLLLRRNAVSEHLFADQQGCGCPVRLRRWWDENIRAAHRDVAGVVITSWDTPPRWLWAIAAVGGIAWLVPMLPAIVAVSALWAMFHAPRLFIHLTHRGGALMRRLYCC